ncbi:MAG: RNase P modulator RnpM [Eggerthellaceae bacterium]|jgi:predicted RNA-binding protein YlxR (DUF448 family)
MTGDSDNNQRSAHTRTCAICGKQADKRTLMRVVRTPGGAVEFDPTGRAAGRGTYICSLACLGKARKGGRLARALKTQMTEEDYNRVADAIAQSRQSSDGETKEW